MDDKTRDLLIGLSILVLISFLASLVIRPVAMLATGDALWSKWADRARLPEPSSETHKIETPRSMPIDPDLTVSEASVPREADPFPDSHGDGKAKPIALNPQIWIDSDDYPAEALRMNWQGTVTIRWMVIDGRAGNCRVVQSSGHAVLDEAACNAILKRARYSPVYDRVGRTLVSEDQRRVVWRLPD